MYDFLLGVLLNIAFVCTINEIVRFIDQGLAG